jgi:CubicO group peptidase (beta-lactamase class C family)/tetratricopeptide (TPR) repeat protein
LGRYICYASTIKTKEVIRVSNGCSESVHVMKFRIFLIGIVLLSAPVWAETDTYEEDQITEPVCRGPHGRPIGRADPLEIESKLNGLEKFIQTKVAEAQIAGLTAGFSYKETQWAKGFGYAHLAKRKRATKSTSYRMASVTKTFTAVGILQLVESGQISLDAEVQTYVPSFPKKKYPVTIRDLLGHLSGVSHYRNCDVECHIKKRLTTKESIAIFQDWELEAAPREKYVYTSYGYNLLGAVIENVTGLSYGDYLKKNIFVPLGMKNSQMDYEPGRNARWAKGYRKRGDRIISSEKINVSSRFAGGGSRSTVEDMLLFGHGLLSGELIRTPTLARMAQSMATTDGLLTKYGMGAAVYPLAGRLVMGHSGGQPETTTLLLMYPHEGLVMAIATNVEDQWSLLYDIAAKIGETILNNGLRRRGAQGANHEAQFFSHAMTSVFGHGIARMKQDETFSARSEDSGWNEKENHTALLQSFQTLNRTMRTEFFETDPVKAYELLERAPGPQFNYAFSRAGAHMARTIVGQCGREQLERYHVDGPFYFFQDYSRICAKNECLYAFQFQNELEERVKAYADAWQRSYPSEVQAVRVDSEPDLPALQEALATLASDAVVKPDFSPIIIHYGEKAALDRQFQKALPLLKRGYELYPMEPKIVLAWGEAHLLSGNEAMGERYLQEGFLLPGGEKRLSPIRIKLRAMVFRRSGFLSAAHSILRVGTMMHPQEATLWDALAKSHLSQGRPSDALVAYEQADAFEPGKKTRQRQIRKLRKDLATDDTGVKKAP